MNVKKPVSSEIYEVARKSSSEKLSLSPGLKKEVQEVALVSKKLFPSTVELTLEESETFRLLCSSAISEPQPPIIRSHRVIIGPVIVFFKKFAWRILNSLLKNQWESQRFFNRRVVRQLAEQVASNRN